MYQLLIISIVYIWLLLIAKTQSKIYQSVLIYNGFLLYVISISTGSRSGTVALITFSDSFLICFIRFVPIAIATWSCSWALRIQLHTKSLSNYLLYNCFGCGNLASNVTTCFGNWSNTSLLVSITFRFSSNICIWFRLLLESIVSLLLNRILILLYCFIMSVFKHLLFGLLHRLFLWISSSLSLTLRLILLLFKFRSSWWIGTLRFRIRINIFVGVSIYHLLNMIILLLRHFWCQLIFWLFA